jgi:hypothetical protein
MVSKRINNLDKNRHGHDIINEIYLKQTDL